MIEIIKKYKLAIISCLIALFGGIFLLFGVKIFNNSIKIKEYVGDEYAFKYDSSWKIKEEKDNIKLVYNKDCEVNIQIITLDEEYKFSTSDDILDELLYNFLKQNSLYKLLSKEKDLVTKYKYDGYRLLYEKDESQVLVIIGKKSDKLLLITYEATSDYFDILLDSFQNIVYDLQIIDDSFNLTYELVLETSKIDWNQNDEIKDCDKVKEYEIANSNYLVKYSIPKNFILNKINSQNPYYNYEELNISLNVSIYNKNIYEYLDKNDTYSTLYYSYKNEREDKEEYSDFIESLEKIENDNYLGYIYKNSYTSIGERKNYEHENVIIIYELDESHILEFEIKAINTKIPKELIDNISLISSKNYASYINSRVEGNYRISELKEYFDYNKDSVRLVELKIPLKYEEIALDGNIYEKRSYGYDYDDDKSLYKYKVTYQFNSSVEAPISLWMFWYKTNEKRGEANELVYVEDKVLNGNLFSVYSGGYTDISGPMFTNINREYYYIDSKLLIYKIEDGKYLSILIEGNGVKVSDDVLNELTNFDIKKALLEGEM